MGVVGAVVDAAIGWLVQNILGSLFTEKMEAWARGVGLDEDVDNLKFEMRNVEMVLAAAEGMRIENKPLALSLHDLKELLYDAKAVMDELDNYRLQQQIEQGDGCTNPEKSPASSSTLSIFQQGTASRVVSLVSHGRKRKREEDPINGTMLPYEIKLDIAERIKGIVNCLHKLGNSVREVLHLEISSSIAMRNQNEARNAHLTTSFQIEDKVYGRDAERDEIIELLINGKSVEDLQVLPIVGIGGVGKTTLARFVYGDRRIRDHFDVQMWVCVSIKADKVRITRDILEHVGPDRQQYENITDFNVLQDILQKNLGNKRFLLVLDDLWEIKNRDLLAPLKHNHVPGCMILVTTRSLSVAKMFGTMDPFHVKGLDEKEFWQFFKACAFGDENHERHPDKVYGRDAERDKIIELLIDGKSEDLQVLPIVGIGGVGKTTLARFVYGDQRIRDHFDVQMWVSVSISSDKVRITRDILEHVGPDRQQYENITDFNVLQDILQKNLGNKRFLLVLDGLWEAKNRDLLAPLKHNHVPGCMILATTRRPSVAKMFGTMDPFHLNGLDEKEFSQFFKACAFGDENHEGHPSLLSIGQQIAKALKGRPLAARSVGAVLNRNVSYEHWRTVQNKLPEDTDDILSILKISYDFLPVHLQRCFSYCSLFPEDCKFDGNNLVRVWILQKFVQCEDPTKRLEEIGKQYMDDLVDLGFFQKVGDSHLVMHDLMHELAQMVSLNECAKRLMI